MNATRDQVYARDRGVCSYRELPSSPPCGLDTDALWSAYFEACEWARTVDVVPHVLEVLRDYPLAKPSAITATRRLEIRRGIDERLKALGFLPGKAFWEADHIRPVSEGGGRTGLDNRRTLCRPHHLKVTRELRARLARRPSKAFRSGNFKR